MEKHIQAFFDAAGHAVDGAMTKLFGETKTTFYPPKTPPTKDYKIPPPSSPTGRMGDSGTFGTQKEMNRIYKANNKR